MRYGINLLLWADTLSDEALPLLDQVKEIGFDAVELPLFESDAAKYAQWGKYLDNAGLARSAVTVRGLDDNPMSSDPKIRRKGIDANKAALDCCQAAGVESLVGPFHSALGYFSGAAPTKDEWLWAVDSMRQVAEYAEKCRVTLALEYLNRFECYLLNTAADGARFCREVNHPRCRMMYDTFHSHIEEKDTSEAIRSLRGMFGARSYFGERPQHARLGQRPLGRDVRLAPRDRLRQPDGDRGVRPRIGKASSGHENLAANVRQRTPTGRRRTQVHERRSRQAVEVMSSMPDPPFDPQPQGISLDELAQAFAQVMGVEPRVGRNRPPSRRPSSRRTTPLPHRSGPSPIGQRQPSRLRN